MVSNRLKRYSLTGPESQEAQESGLAGAVWFKSDVPRRRLKELTRRTDYPAIRDTVIWWTLLLAAGFMGFLFWGSLLAIPFFLVYGVLYGTASDSRLHECGHGTPFRSLRLNNVVFQVAAFMMMEDPTVVRWRHSLHHTDTLIVGRDPEIRAMRPARLATIILDAFGIIAVPRAFGHMFVHATGQTAGEEEIYIPSEERSKITLTARIWLAIYAATVAAVIVTGSILPLMFIGLPRMYGQFIDSIYNLTQHAGMGENVLDYRLNSRTVKMNRINRFLYWNMNYHVEHHMFPMVPYHRLPELHEEIKHDLAPAYNSIWEAYREIVPAIIRQLKDQTYYVHRALPSSAAPFYPPGAGDDGVIIG